MNHLNIFFRTRIKNTGFLAALGNFFLKPFQMLFSAKTVLVKQDKRIAKVSSFQEMQNLPSFTPKKSKQDPELKSSLVRGKGTYIIALIFLIPSTILGSIFKAFSYFSSTVRESHRLVKAKLTPQILNFGSKDEMINQTQLSKQLNDHLMSGQKIGIIIIRGQGSIPRDMMDLIIKLNPSKLILNSEIVTDLQAFSLKRREKWDVSALNNESRTKLNIVHSEERALNRSLSFFGPKHIVYKVDKNQPSTPKTPHSESNGNVYSIGCFGTPRHHDQQPGSHYYYMSHRTRSPY